MLQRGMAWAFDRYLEKFEDHAALKEMESVAKSNGIGVWQREAEPPWQFRKRYLEQGLVPQGVSAGLNLR